MRPFIYQRATDPNAAIAALGQPSATSANMPTAEQIWPGVQ